MRRLEGRGNGKFWRARFLQFFFWLLSTKALALGPKMDLHKFAPCRCSINLRNKYWVKVVNAIFAKSFTPTMQMWHLSSLPHIYSSVFTFLRYICMERICANPLFSSSVGDKTQLLPEQKKLSLYWRFYAYCRPFCLENCLVVYLVLWRLSLDSSKCFSIASVYEEFNIHSDCS